MRRTLAFLPAFLALVTPGSAYSDEPRVLNAVFSRSLVTNVHENDALAAIKVWVDHLTKELGEDLILGSEIHITSGQDELETLMQTQKVDVAVLHPVEYVGIESWTDMAPRYTAVRDGEVAYGVSLLVRKDSSINSLLALRGKTLIGERSVVGILADLWIEKLLADNDLGDPDAFFGKVVSADRVTQAALAVFFGQADACTVKLDSYRTMVEMNPQVGAELPALHGSMAFCRTVICVGGLGSREGQMVNDAPPSLHETSRGRQLLAMFSVDELVPFRPEYLDGIRRLLNGTPANTSLNDNPR